MFSNPVVWLQIVVLSTMLPLGSAWSQEKQTESSSQQEASSLSRAYSRIVYSIPEAVSLPKASQEYVQEHPWAPSGVSYLSGWHHAKDGHYIAKTEEEIEAYETLGATYRYLQDDIWRRHLKLNEKEGILIETVDESSLAGREGLRAGDLVLRVEDAPVVTQYEFVQAIDQRRDKPARIYLLRDGDPQEVTVTLPAKQTDKKRHFYLGVSAEPISPALRSHLKMGDKAGVLLTAVTADGPAAKAGVEVHDILVRINGQAVADTASLRKLIAQSEGKPLELTIIHGGDTRTVRVTPAERKESEAKVIYYDVPYGVRQYAPLTVMDTAYKLVYPPTVNRTVTSYYDPPKKEDRLSTVLKQLEKLQQELDAIKKTLQDR